VVSVGAGPPGPASRPSAYELAHRTWPAEAGCAHQRLSATVDAPRQARRWARDHLVGPVSAGAQDDAALMLTELVTNAVLHAGAPSGRGIDLYIAATLLTLRTEVCDGGRGFATGTVSPPSSESPGGRGLLIVDRLASRWGTSTDEGHCVWFEIDL
jgi:anti-sigma regulatory factor (Ser/Thr protein kinase)